MNTTAQTVADILIDIKAVNFRFDPPFTYTSGIKSPIYLDNRVVMSYPEKRKIIIDLYVSKINKLSEPIEYISATATAAIPQGAWIAEKLNLPLVYCRSSKKEHGKENQIEGHIKKGSTAIIIEDHISTAGSSIVNAEALRALGVTVSHVFATTTYETETSQKQLEEHGLSLHALTTGKIIVDRAVERGVLTEEQKKTVHEWFADPAGWRN